MKNINNKEISVFVGLLKKDMKTKLNQKATKNLILKEFKQIKVIGGNLNLNKGVWAGKEEPSLIFSFINTFKVSKKDILKVIKNLKQKLDQESILITIKPIEFNFI